MYNLLLNSKHFRVELRAIKTGVTNRGTKDRLTESELDPTELDPTLQASLVAFGALKEVTVLLMLQLLGIPLLLWCSFEALEVIALDAAALAEYRGEPLESIAAALAEYRGEPLE